MYCVGNTEGSSIWFQWFLFSSLWKSVLSLISQFHLLQDRIFTNDIKIVENFNVKKVNRLIFLKIFLFILRERGREGEKEGEKHQCVVASHAPPTGDLAWQPRHVLWLGIEPATLWFAGWHSIHWTTPARVSLLIF